MNLKKQIAKTMVIPMVFSVMSNGFFGFNVRAETVTTAKNATINIWDVVTSSDDDIFDNFKNIINEEMNHLSNFPEVNSFALYYNLESDNTHTLRPVSSTGLKILDTDRVSLHLVSLNSNDEIISTYQIAFGGAEAFTCSSFRVNQGDAKFDTLNTLFCALALYESAYSRLDLSEDDDDYILILDENFDYYAEEFFGLKMFKQLLEFREYEK